MRERRFEQRERLAHGLPELAGERRRVHAAGRAHEQRVVEQHAQPGKRVRDSGLREPEAHRRGSDVFFTQHDIEDAEQVEVHILNIHDNDSYHESH